MVSGPLNLLASRARHNELRRTAGRRRRTDSGETPVTRVTLRYAAAADVENLRVLAELDSAATPVPPVLVAEVDGRLRAALRLDGSAPIADPFHRGVELIELLRTRAEQLGSRA